MSQTPSANLAQIGNFLNAFSISSNTSYPWIIDSGATDHMTGLSNLFFTYKPLSGKQKVKIADGSLSSVAGKGSISVSKTMILKSVLHVPNLPCNLLSVSKLTKDLNCMANFSPSNCEFQDLCTGKKIGSAKEVDGLYYFEEEPEALSNLSLVDKIVSQVPSENEISLMHLRLGHPNFSYLKLLFPTLFKNKSDINFKCEVCELSKHHRTHFPAQTYKVSQPFSLIQSDVWYPLRFPNNFGDKWFVTFIDDHTRVCWVYLLKEKSEVSKTFQIFHKVVQTQFQAKSQVF